MADRLMAELPTEDAAAAAIRRLRDEGFVHLEAYLPFPSHVVEEALARRPSRLPIAVFAFGMAGAGGAYLLQWYLVAYLYPLVVGGRPPHFPLAFLIITFEMGVLAAALCAFFGTLFLGKLFRLIDGVQGTPGFESATRDRFWIEVRELRGPELDRARRLLAESGALVIERGVEP
jgi:hypothetical protein